MMAKVKITLPTAAAFRGKIEIDGQDVSEMVTGFMLTGDVKSVVRLELIMRPGSVEVVADEAEVDVIAEQQQ